MSQGVPEDCIFAVAQDEIVDVALGLAQPGDFLVLTTTTQTLHKDWAKVTQS